MSEEPQKQNIPQPSQVAQVYFNSFGIGISGADVFMQISANNTPIAVLNCSFNVAKSFATGLNETLRQVEEKTKQKIMTIDEVQAAIGLKKPQ